ncbi:MAG: hypothetical protein JWO09_385 [Bacteroidetes bacterium]|nr:hypothetical protein [Bacteroidota bacterium]
MKFILACIISAALIVGLYLFQGEKREWIMPKELNEISGIAFVNDHTLACVQDENGIIFLYDLQKSEITQRISFAGKGDFEGIALKGKDAYIVTGDGVLYEVHNFLSGEPEVSLYSLSLPNEAESEAICYDSISGKLLLAFKNHEKDEINPGVFAFDLKTKTVSDTAILQVNFRSPALRKKDRDKYKKLWQPADLTVDPASGRIFMIDAINGHLMEISREGRLEKLTDIARKVIRHPEGIAIAADGSIYLCNDGNNDGKGKIVKWKN